MSAFHPRALQRRVLLVATAGLLASLTPSLAAHGGQYRGTSDVQPPSTKSSGSGGTNPSTGSGGTAGGSAGNTGTGSAASGTGSAAGAPATPGLGSGPRRGVPLQDDPSSWSTWWEFRKDPLLRARDAVGKPHTAPEEAMLGRGGELARSLEGPTATEIRERVVPALHAALARSTDRDTLTGCMVALAKIGVDLPEATIDAALRPHLRSRDQEVRETAALCFGIARRRTATDVELLCALAADTVEGRHATDRSSVDERTRAFACYGLGLFLADGEDGQRQQATAALIALLADPGTARNVTVATIAALGQLGRSADRRRLREEALAALDAYYQRPLGPGGQLLQAQCPVALAQLVDRTDLLAARLRDRYAADLEASLASPGSAGRGSLYLAQSCALALAELALPWDDADSEGAAVGQLLLRCYREHKDQQTRWFAALALGRCGGAAARAALLRELARAGKSIEMPWIALALASQAQTRLRRAAAQGASPDADRELQQALLAQLDSVKNPDAMGALAVALGMCQATEAGDRLRALLRDYESRDEVAGQLAIALAMLGERRAARDIRSLLSRSVRRPHLLVQLATALGRLGDANVVDDLTTMLADSDGGLARLSAVAGAVGHIGDRRAIEPLLGMLADEQLTALTRAFAAVALGGVCDRDPVPWNARFAATLNYRAAVETLTDGAAGILDIL